jgi:hypothetical protein
MIYRKMMTILRQINGSSTSVTTLAMSSGVTKSLPRINALAQLALYKSILALGLAPNSI